MHTIFSYPLKFLKALPSWIWNHKRVSAILLVILILGFIFRPKTPVSVPIQKITKGNLIVTVSVSGLVNATSVNLTFPISGKVVYMGAKKGDMVQNGQTIASLDERTIEDNLQSAVKAAQNQQISFDTVNDFNGDRDLSDTGLSTSARRQLQTAMNTLDQTQLAVAIQQIAKEQAYLISPIDGILTRADVETPGVTASLTTTYTVVDPTSIVFDMDVDQADIGTVRVGQPVTIVFDAYPSDTLHESVKSIDFVSHTTSNGDNAFTVETELPNSNDYKYRVGMNANADIVTNEKDNVVTVPLESLDANNFVYVKTPKGFEKRKVVLGLQNDTDAEVISGLTGGETIALDPTAAQQQAISTSK